MAPRGPRTPDRGASLWFSAVCAIVEECNAGGRAERLLRGRSTEKRLEELISYFGAVSKLEVRL